MEHKPVLLKECIAGLNIKPDGVYVDGTLGRGGHALEIVKRLDSGRLIAIDRDADALSEAAENLSGYSARVTYVHDNFINIAQILDAAGISGVDGMLFDLGVSSPQLDDAGRGFSYMQDAPLDMRMDRRAALSAFDIVNKWQEEDIYRILRDYGEERYSRRIARAIVKRRESAPVNGTFELNDIILSAIPSAARREAQHPSKRCYQALRIAVNDELGAVSGMLSTAPDKLNPGGRLCVICFHSLESRCVKNAFASRANGCTCPKDFPVCVCGFVPTLKIITKKAITPDEDEIRGNTRARSATLRIAERIQGG